MTKVKEGRYTYYIIPEQKLIKCVSSYAKKPYVGIAKCNDKDTFDENIGKHIARVRCDDKINKKRIKSLEAYLDNAFDIVRFWEKEHSRLCVLMKIADAEKRRIDIEKKKIKDY